MTSPAYVEEILTFHRSELKAKDDVIRAKDVIIEQNVNVMEGLQKKLDRAYSDRHSKIVEIVKLERQVIELKDANYEK